jgi:hypothetical protein
MNLQGCDLSIEMQREVIQLLQSELRQIEIWVDDRELFLSEATRKGMLSLQRRNAPEAYGEYEGQGVKLSVPEANALKLKPEPDEGSQEFVIHEQIDHQE